MGRQNWALQHQLKHDFTAPVIANHTEALGQRRWSDLCSFTRTPWFQLFLLQNIWQWPFKPCKEPAFTSSFCYCLQKKKKKSMLTFLLKLLFNSGGPRIIANFLQGICSLKCTVWNFSFSLLFFFIIFYLRLVLSLLRTCKCGCFWMLQSKCWKWQLKWNH